MEFMVEELIASPKTEVRTSKSSKSNISKIVRNTTLLEALAKGGNVTSYTNEDGQLKIKILVKKQDLKQMLKSINKDNNIGNDSSKVIRGVSSSSSSSMERRLYDLMKRKRVIQAKERVTSNWKPGLQSIPEEY